MSAQVNADAVGRYLWVLHSAAHHEAAHAIVGALTGLRPIVVRVLTKSALRRNRSGEVDFAGDYSSTLDAPMLCAGYFGALRASRPLTREQRSELRTRAAADLEALRAVTAHLAAAEQARFIRSAALCAGRLARSFWPEIQRLAGAFTQGDVTTVRGRRLEKLLANALRAEWHETPAGRAWLAATAPSPSRPGR